MSSPEEHAELEALIERRDRDIQQLRDQVRSLASVLGVDCSGLTSTAQFRAALDKSKKLLAPQPKPAEVVFVASTQWEYSETCLDMEDGRSRRKLLAELGAEGWELAILLPGGFAILKRPLP